MTRARWIAKPERLSSTAKTIWDYYSVGLEKEGRLTPETAESFRLLCEILAVAHAAAAEIERFGVTIEAKSGARRANPALQTLMTTQREAEKLLFEFGLSTRGQIRL